MQVGAQQHTGQGKSFGPYEILGEIARGGQGAILRARLTASGEMVALKMLTSREPEARKRFLQEGKVLAGLSHPNLLRVTDLGELNGITYLAMELVQGRDLESVLRSGGLPGPQWIAKTLSTVAHALHYCHLKGIVHRDLKPGNVLIEDGTERAVLVDFGLVKRDPEKMRLSSLDGGTKLSKTGEVKGTPKFMAPEQASPAKYGAVSERTDVYALGATLYALLTGRPPFEGDTVVAILSQVIGEAPADPRTLNPHTPPALAEFCLRSLAKQPQARPASAAAFATELCDLTGLRAWLPSFPTLDETQVPADLGRPLTDKDPRRLGPYELVSLLGAGGMGAVYRARHTILGAERAVKVMKTLGGNPRRVQRFQREIQHLARVHHPNVVAIHDSGAEGNWAWYAMDLIAGESLSELLARGRLSFPEALRVAIGVSRGVGALHRAGIVHRDLKPQNIVLRRDGTPLVLDLGLAVAPELDERLTKTGAVVGTPHYMAPEQIRGKQIDPRTDVFALGLVFFELVTGRRAVEGDSVASVMAAALSDSAPVPSDVDAELPRMVDAICADALARDPAKRPADATAFGERLVELSLGPVRKRRGVSPALAGAMALLVTGLLVGAGWLASGELNPQPPATPNEQAAHEEDPDPVPTPELDPRTLRQAERDLNELSELENPRARHEAALAWLDAYSWHPRADEVRELADAASSLYPLLSCSNREFYGEFLDASRFITWRGGEDPYDALHFRSVETGEELAPQRKLPFPVMRVVVDPWRETVLVAGASKEVLVLDLGTLEPVRVLDVGMKMVNTLRFSPDGSLLAVAGRDQPDAEFKLKLLDGASGALVRECNPVRGSPRSLAFSPDGARLILAGGSAIFSEKATIKADTRSGIWTYDVASGKIAVNTPMQSSVGAVSFVPGQPDRYLVGTNGGRLLTYELGNANAVSSIVSDDTQFRTDGPSLLLNAHGGSVRRVIYSRDGDRLFTCASETTPDRWGEVAVWDREGKRQRRIRLDGTSLKWLALSPDERWLLLGNFPEGVTLWRAR